MVGLVVPLAIARWLAGIVPAPKRSLTPSRRVGLALAGGGLLATWAGLLVAPSIPLVLAVLSQAPLP